jgi:hypothetical protein
LRSLIVPQYPPLFEEFRVKRFSLLWRGSRDGFTAKEFDRRCDGRANTFVSTCVTLGNWWFVIRLLSLIDCCNQNAINRQNRHLQL